VDLVAIVQPTAELRLKNLLPAVQFVEEHLLSFFPQAHNYVWQLRSNEGPAPRGGRPSPPSVELLERANPKGVPAAEASESQHAAASGERGRRSGSVGRRIATFAGAAAASGGRQNSAPD